MSRKEQTQISNEVVYELLKDEDGKVYGIGNSIEVTRAQAVEMIKAGLAKHERAPIGELPDGWGSAGAEVRDGGNSNE
jgi:hypothetical protein